MDLSVIQKNQEVMGVERFGNQYGSHIFNLKDTFAETDIKGNNNLFHSLKTEHNDHGHDPGSLFQDVYNNEKKTRVESSPISYPSFKRAIDLRVHNRTTDGGKRTIFDDADYFAKNFCYKLLPITFENVDETIIHIEHNYSLFSLCSESEAEEDCSRTMDYSQIKEKNYKRRRTKFRDGSEEEWDVEEEEDNNCSVPEETRTECVSQSEDSFAVQPLDLSSPLVQEEKTDRRLIQNPTSIVNNAEEKEEEKKNEEEDKENVISPLGCIKVTITRPDEKDNYQPCDLFLNDIARLVPRLIGKDCSEIDILDRTCDRRHVDIKTHRLYYVISEPTWELFQSTTERIILTNDESLGEPVQKRQRVERPTFLVFDQFSLAKCLADFCQEIGGCFEYTFLETTKGLEESPQEDPVKNEKTVQEKGAGVEVESEKKKETVQEDSSSKEEAALEEENVKEIPENGKEETKSDENPVEPQKPEEESAKKEANAEARATESEKENKKKSSGKETKKKSEKRERPPPSESISRIRTRSKSNSESETPNNTKTSQQISDKTRRSRHRQGDEEVLSKEEKPNKRRKVSACEERTERRTRSGKPLGEDQEVKVGGEKKTAERKSTGSEKKKEEKEETISTRLRSRKESQRTSGPKEKPPKRRR